MVPCMYQRNAYIKRKLMVWRVQKCIYVVGANTALKYACRQTTPSHLSQYGAENENLRKFGSTFRHGTVFAPKQCLSQKEATGMESPKMHYSRRAKTAPTSAGRQTSLSYVSQYRAENGNLRKSGSTFRHGTVFAPKECLHQKEDRGMESPKMHSCSW